MPTAKISKTSIDKLTHPQKGQVFLWDTELKGFGVCINRFSKTFIVQRDVNGTSKRISVPVPSGFDPRNTGSHQKL